MTQPAFKTSKLPLLSTSARRLRKVHALGMALLFLAGTAVPVMAKTPMSAAAIAPITASSSDQLTESAQLEAPTEVRAEAQTEADIQRIVNQAIAAETQSWSPNQKAALETLAQMNLSDRELAALATLSATDLQNTLKSDQKFAKLSATGISSQEALKLAPMLLLSRYLLNIGRAAVWGGVVSAIRAADFDYPALARALTTGNTREFSSLLRQGLTSQTSFVNTVSDAANFACGAATLDVTPTLCSRFANGLQKIFLRIDR